MTRKRESPPESTRPKPPKAIVERLFGIRFAPADGLAEWVRKTILEDGAPLYNEEHRHLLEAEIGFLWASSGYVKNGRRILGMTERVDTLARSHPWANARLEQQLSEWFPDAGALDFVVTLDAQYANDCTDAEFCALLEHELYHCGHATDEFGIPKFSKEGRPKYAIRGHDVEEFVGVVRRYGVIDTGVEELVKAVAGGPQIAPVRIAQACGTCALRLAA